MDEKLTISENCQTGQVGQIGPGHDGQVIGEGREIGKSFACLEKFTTGVTIVTYKGINGRTGLTVNLFAPVSLDPPIVQISIEKLAKAYKELENRPFTVNILHAGQEELALYFGGRRRGHLVIEWVGGELLPRLQDSLAYLECIPSTYTDYGDHRQYIGHVIQFAFSEKAPLTYFSGKFGQIATKPAL